MPDEIEFSDDMIRGAGQLAHFLFGSPRLRRKAYHLVATSNLPVFKLGSMICARKSVLLKWVHDQETRHPKKGPPQPEKTKDPEKPKEPEGPETFDNDKEDD
jgi:hypothetical protein